jgi:hypothetical protein
VLSVRTVGNRFYYSLTNRRALTDFVGTLPAIVPDWNALFGVVEVVRRVSRRATELAHEALVIEVHEAAREIEEDLQTLALASAVRLRGDAFIGEWNEWAERLMSDLASGGWPLAKTGVTLSSWG